MGRGKKKTEMTDMMSEGKKRAGDVRGGTKCQGNIFIRWDVIMPGQGDNAYAKIYKGRKRLVCLLYHAVCTTPRALFIQLGQLAIILPQRNQTAFITTI